MSYMRTGPGVCHRALGGTYIHTFAAHILRNFWSINQRCNYLEENYTYVYVHTPQRFMQARYEP